MHWKVICRLFIAYVIETLMSHSVRFCLLQTPICVSNRLQFRTSYRESLRKITVKYIICFSFSSLPKITQGNFIALLPVVYESSNLLTDLEAGKEHNRNLIALMPV